MVAQGIPSEPDVMKPQSTTVFSFPMQAPSTAVFRQDMTAIEQLNIWLKYQTYWCEHKPSVTISVKEHEWLEVGAWVYEHFDEVSGISFLPFSEHTYKQAPYQDCTEVEYKDSSKCQKVLIGQHCLSLKKKIQHQAVVSWHAPQVCVK